MFGFVIGVSRGIDSAVVSTLCALKKKNVLCLDMSIHQNKNEITRSSQHINWLEKKFSNVNHYKIYLSEVFDLFKNNVHKLIENKFSTYRQSHINSTYFSRDSINFNNIIIDRNKTSFEIHNQIRAFIFKEYQLPKISGYYIKNSVLTTDKIKQSPDTNKLIYN